MTSTMAFTRWKIIVNLDGAAKQMRKQTLLALRQKKVNHVHIHSSVLIVMEITRWTPTCVYSRSIGLIANNTSRNIMRLVKIGPN